MESRYTKELPPHISASTNQVPCLQLVLGIKLQSLSSSFHRESLNVLEEPSLHSNIISQRSLVYCTETTHPAAEMQLFVFIYLFKFL